MYFYLENYTNKEVESYQRYGVENDVDFYYFTKHGFFSNKQESSMDINILYQIKNGIIEEVTDTETLNLLYNLQGTSIKSEIVSNEDTNKENNINEQDIDYDLGLPKEHNSNDEETHNGYTVGLPKKEKITDTEVWVESEHNALNGPNGEYYEDESVVILGDFIVKDKDNNFLTSTSEVYKQDEVTVYPTTTVTFLKNKMVLYEKYSEPLSIPMYKVLNLSDDPIYIEVTGNNVVLDNGKQQYIYENTVEKFEICHGQIIEHKRDGTTYTVDNQQGYDLDLSEE